MHPRVTPAGRDDMAPVRQIAANFGLLGDWPGAADFLECEREYGRLLLARDGTVPIGFGGTLCRGELTHLGDLFVDVPHQSAGVGRALLDGLFDAPGPRITFASADPRAVPLYIRYGMVPRCPIYYLSGQAEALPVVPGDAVSTVEVSEVVAADAVASGGSREQVLRWYAGLPEVRVHAGKHGYAFAREVGDRVVIGPAGGTTPTGCAETVLGTAARYRGRSVRLAVFGVHPLLPRLLAAGMRMVGTDTYLASDADLVPVDRYVPNPDLG